MKIPPHRNWNILQPDPSKIRYLTQTLGISHFLGSLLINRGIETEEEARKFLFPSYDDLSDPFLLPDMDKAVERIKKAIKKDESIMIYGDYDCDGTTSVAVLLNALKFAGAKKVGYYVPNRFKDGYGVNKESITEMRKEGYTLIITVDCGVTAIEAVNYANFLGMDVIVTDHHLPIEGQLPDAHALVTPHAKESNCPYKSFAGVGLAFKLASGLINNKSYLSGLLDIVTIGTIVDVAPLNGENRTITKLGLNRLNNHSKPKRPGIRALCSVARLSNNHILTGHDFSFQLGPRINAAGRAGDARIAVELLISDSYKEAEKIALQLDNMNAQRKKLQARIYDQAMEFIKRDELHKDNAIVIAHDWGERAKGIVGIVASRLMETFNKPVVLLTVNDDKASGSGRSDDRINLSDALLNCSDVLLTHGGHSAAAGLSLDRSDIGEFRDKLNRYAEDNIDPETVVESINVDYELDYSYVDERLINEIAAIEPCGQKNKYPLIYTKGIRVPHGTEYMGQTTDHLKFVTAQKEGEVTAIQWRGGKYKETFEEDGSVFAMIYEPKLHFYHGKGYLRAEVEDWKVMDTDLSIKACKDQARDTLMKYQDFFLDNMGLYVIDVYEAYQSIMETDPNDWSSEDWQTFEEELLFCKDN